MLTCRLGDGLDAIWPEWRVTVPSEQLIDYLWTERTPQFGTFDWINEHLTHVCEWHKHMVSLHLIILQRPTAASADWFTAPSWLNSGTMCVKSLNTHLNLMHMIVYDSSELQKLIWTGSRFSLMFKTRKTAVFIWTIGVTHILQLMLIIYCNHILPNIYDNKHKETPLKH